MKTNILLMLLGIILGAVLNLVFGLIVYYLGESTDILGDLTLPRVVYTLISGVSLGLFLVLIRYTFYRESKQ